MFFYHTAFISVLVLFLLAAYTPHLLRRLSYQFLGLKQYGVLGILSLGQISAKPEGRTATVFYIPFRYPGGRATCATIRRRYFVSCVCAEHIIRSAAFICDEAQGIYIYICMGTHILSLLFGLPIFCFPSFGKTRHSRFDRERLPIDLAGPGEREGGGRVRERERLLAGWNMRRMLCSARQVSRLFFKLLETRNRQQR